MIVVLSLSMMTFLARPRSVSVHGFELHAEASNIGRAAGQDGDVFQHGLAAIAVAGRLDGTALERAAEAVDDQRGQGFAVDVLGDDQQRLALLTTASSSGTRSLMLRDLLLVDQDVGVFEHACIVFGSVTKYGER